jgi:hypothetical protein
MRRNITRALCDGKRTDKKRKTWFVLEPTFGGRFPKIKCMDIRKIRVIAIDRLYGDAVISFHDNRTAVFPASFLYDSLSQVQELFESELELDDEPQAAR